MYVFGAHNTGDHYFGYDCGMPENIVIDGLTVNDSNIEADDLCYYLFPDYDPTFAPNKPYPYSTPKNVSAKISTKSGREIKICEKPEEYPFIFDMELD